METSLKMIWKLPYNCHTATIERLSDSIPIFDFISDRNLNFNKNCLPSDNILVNSVAHHVVFISRMTSGICRNIHSCCERYRMHISGFLDMPPKQKLSINVENDVERMVGSLYEVRDGSMSLSGGMLIFGFDLLDFLFIFCFHFISIVYLYVLRVRFFE